MVCIGSISSVTVRNGATDDFTMKNLIRNIANTLINLRQAKAYNRPSSEKEKYLLSSVMIR